MLSPSTHVYWCVFFIYMFCITFYAYYLPYLMLHGYFVSAIFQILGQEQIRRKEWKLANRWYQMKKKDAEPEIWSRVETSQLSLHAKSEQPQKSGTKMDQEFGHPAVYFDQAAVDQSTGMPTQRSTRVKKWSTNTVRRSASQLNFWPASRTMAVLMDKIFPEIRKILDT